MPPEAKRAGPGGDAARDAALLLRVGRGDEAALRLLYERHADVLYSLARRMLGDPREAEDALQDAFLRIWRGASRWDAARSAAFTWMVLLQRRACLDRHRARQREQRWFVLSDDEPSLAEARTEPATEDTFADSAEELRRVLDHLPGEQRDLIELAFYSGWTHEEIACERQLPLGTVKARIRRGLTRLRELLKEWYD